MKDITKNTQKAFGARLFAGLIDLFIWGALFIVVTLKFGEVTTTTNAYGTSSNAHLTGMPLLVFVLLWLFYFISCEWRFGGSIGKLITGVLVVGGDGRPITLKQSAIRNVCRLIDAFPFVIPYLLGILMIAGDERKRRLGDRLANTLVVKK